ncbi:hypothetical protein RHMOL_Rhmol01G0383100 [Rhododendron molle]|uniref:Uncharacterized protein n=1 Tax=Rhododendron molle TaxID=49168 RepID=A0ACC0QC61_RHOML|nr:hypothetical protein RHMOL_Rhmol01G0383100 [Rhododendron molle]
MLGTKQDSTVLYDHPSETFTGVRFVLLGFDPINAQKVRSKLVNGGGVDVCHYGPHCTHVIVDKLVYDDPMCVAARTDGKVLVTGLWVDHSFDIGMPVDPTSVMYRPSTDLDGIPGAKSLVVCLTGYQRQDRDDIMTMVGLMGATFSKPLVANKVTHLICYKYEGEKYELAKKMKKIALVNHRWLEDCLRAWEILPEADYDKSGYELEMLEAEAKDSEEEAHEIPMKQFGESKINVSPHNLHIGTLRAHPSPLSKEEVSRNLLATSASKDLSKTANNINAVFATAEETLPVKASNSQHIRKKHPEVPCFQDTRTLGDVSCGEPSEQPFNSHERTTTSAKAGTELTSTSESAKMSPYSDAAKSTVNYSSKTPRRNTLSVLSAEIAKNLSNTSEVDIDKSNVSVGFGFSISSSKAEQAEGKTDSGFIPSKKTVLRNEGGKSDALPEKRKMDVSYGSSKSRKMSGSPLVNDKTEGSEPAVLVNGALDENAPLGPGHKSLPDLGKTFLSSFDRKSLSKPVVNAVTWESRHEDNLEALQTSFTGLDDMSFVSEPGIKDVMNGEAIRVVSPKTGRLDVKKSVSPSLDKGENADSNSKPSRRKMIAKKSLGSRPRLGPGNTKNQNGSICRNETALQSDVVTTLVGGKETANTKIDNSGIVEMITSTVNVEESGKEPENKTGSMDDETEAPEDKVENEFEAEEKPRDVDGSPTNKMSKVMNDKSEDEQPTPIRASATRLSSDNLTKTSDQDGNGAELEKAVHGRNQKPDKSTIKEDGEKEKSTERRKRPLSKTWRKSVPSDEERRKSDEGVSGEESRSKKNTKKIGKDKDKSIPSPIGKTKKAVPLSKSVNSMDIEKENWPVGVGDQNVCHSEQQGGKVALKSNISPTKIDPNAVVTNRDSTTVKRILKVKVEPVWFILSGHRLQRKEFQQVIRRLKGRVCRDSHQWSYQATHFIVPDPIRRTEKFFAAAASGRWILNTDYLTASNQAGRLLAEEPYEWHKTALSEDGAINLEAPRKWRLLRERTGHGAFYGMRVVIYGECIAPPLDTLKRVIRAGDGTILATSPPYTRYLEAGVDFAIVSPGMPRVDMWVQEFLRHEIPCVLADYLVEFVCKPGYSLERHVQYNSHAWAERSFANLLRRLEEVVVVEEQGIIYDLPCQICGSRDRGEVMLICGDECGSTGCGVGTHIDCCNPPLEHVPDEDWFCTKCSESRNSGSHPKSTKKRTSVSKGK